MGLTGIKIKYFSPAYPPQNIHLNWIYELGFNEHGAYVFDGNLETFINYEVLKTLFRPLNYHSWNEVDNVLFPRKSTFIEDKKKDKKETTKNEDVVKKKIQAKKNNIATQKKTKKTNK